MAKRTLLVADDDEMNRVIIGKFLGREYEVLEAADGRETLALLHEKPVDALLLDIIMPEMDGLEVLEEMQKEPSFKHIGVLVATSTKEKTERQALALGADDVVAKPYDPIVITTRLRNILAMKELARREAMGSTAAAPVDTEAIERIRDKICRTVTIIEKNVSNHKLVLACTADIRQQADALEKISL